jgi:hypothetical protein
MFNDAIDSLEVVELLLFDKLYNNQGTPTLERLDRVFVSIR